MPVFLGLGCVTLSCLNLALSKAFYECLGLKFQAERHGNGPEHYAATLPSGLTLELYPSGSLHTSGVRFTLFVDVPELLAAKLTAAGYGRRPGSELTFFDPDANIVALHPRPEARPPSVGGPGCGSEPSG